MLRDTDDAAIQADAYIDGLLTVHKRSPVALAATDHSADDSAVHRAINLLERGLPRFHPSFLFEEWLAGQLRRQSGGGAEAEGIGRIMPIAVMRPAAGGVRLPDRRLLVGGAIASGVSIGAAMYAWRRKRD